MKEVLIWFLPVLLVDVAWLAMCLRDWIKHGFYSSDIDDWTAVNVGLITAISTLVGFCKLLIYVGR